MDLDHLFNFENAHLLACFFGRHLKTFTLHVTLILQRIKIVRCCKKEQ